MKLLTPTQLQDIKAQTIARDALRSKELNEAADKARKRLATTEADFSQMVAGQRLRWAKEEEEHTQDVARKQAELAILEEKRVRAIQPVNKLMKQAADTLSNAQNALLSVEKRENDVEGLRELLEDRLDVVGSREQDVLLREQRNDIQEKALVAQQKLVEDNTAYVNQSLRDLMEQKQHTLTELDKLRTALTLQERSLDARSEKIVRQEEKLSVIAQQLADQRKTLERAVIRTREEKKVR